MYTSWVWNLLPSPLALVKQHDEWEPWLTLAALAHTDSRSSSNHQAFASLSQQHKATSATWLMLQIPPLMISACPNENKPHGEIKACLMAGVWNWYFYLHSHSSRWRLHEAWRSYIMQFLNLNCTMFVKAWRGTLVTTDCWILCPDSLFYLKFNFNLIWQARKKYWQRTRA